MTAGILLRDDFDGSALRRLARQSHNAGQTRRLLALAEIYGGGSRSDAARIAASACRSCATGLSVSAPGALMVS